MRYRILAPETTGLTVCRGDTASTMVSGAMVPQNVKVSVYKKFKCESTCDLDHFFAEVRCPEPILAEHGILSVTGNDRMYGRTLIRTGTLENSNTGATSYKIGALVKYRCERGYKVVGEPLSTCEDNGRWSGDVPQCVCKCSCSITSKTVPKKLAHTCRRRLRKARRDPARSLHTSI